MSTPAMLSRLGRADSQLAEVLNASILLCWGGWLLMPWSTFAAAPASFGLMARCAPEWLWGLLPALCGLGQILAVLLDAKRWRRRAMLASAACWAFLAGWFIAQDWRLIATALYPMHALGQALLYLQAGRRWDR